MEKMAQFSVLIVDDNPYSRDLLNNILLSENFLVEEAVNGKEAVEKVSKKPYQLILMDMLMPGMNGYEAAKKIRQMGITTPIIAQSSMSSKEDRLRSFESGCNDFLPKPFEIKELFDLVNKYFSGVENVPEKVEITSKDTVTYSSPLDFSGYKLLLVEENDETAKNFYHVLKSLKFEVTWVLNGAEALKLLQNPESNINIVVGNVFTSGIDGFGLLAISKRENPQIPVFLYTSDFNQDTLQLASQLGADCFIPRSIFEDSAADLIDSALNRSTIRISPKPDKSAVEQIRQSQAQLIQFEFIDAEGLFDYAYSSLLDAGGDMARFRRFNLAGRYGIVLADVAGHDIRSSYLSAIFFGVLSSLWNNHQEPDVLLRTINAEMIKLNTSNYHTCVTALLWDKRRKKVKISTSGNPGGLLVLKNADGSLNYKELPGGGMCLGLLNRNDLFGHSEFNFEPDGYLFLFSDGIKKEQIIEALPGRWFQQKQVNIKGLCQLILDKILEKWQQDDDMILIALRASSSFSDFGIHNQFKSCFDGVDQACKWINEQIQLNEVPPGINSDSLLLGIRETLLNAVEHGNRQKPDSFVDVSLYLKPGELRVDVSDAGSGFNLAECLTKIENLDGFQIGKRGLSLIKSVADSIEVNGSTISLTFRQKQ